MIDRSALDGIIQAGGFISVNAGGAPDANALPISQEIAEKAMDAAPVHRLRRLRCRMPQCIGNAVYQR